MTITKFDRSNLDTVRAVVEKHLQAAAKELGINLRTGKINYSDHATTIKVEATTGDGLDQYRDALRMLAKVYGMPGVEPGTTFKRGGDVIEVIGLDMKKRNEHTVLIRVNGEARPSKLMRPADVMRAVLATPAA